MHVLVAPDKFKGYATAERVADIIGAACVDLADDVEVTLLPLADGGEGTLDLMMRLPGSAAFEARVTGPVGEPVRARFGRVEDRVVVEAAQACGLHLVPPGRVDPLSATTRGVGELLLHAAREAPGARRFLVGVGGTATTDGGTGAARAWGWRFLDARGRDLPEGGAPLRNLREIVAPPRPPAVEIVAAVDVSNPLLGQRGAAAVFAPQKGASPAQVAVLEEGLEVLAGTLASQFGSAVSDLPGAGSGGGLGAGLAAFLGATLSPGFEMLADAADLRGRLDVADVVITGEGRLDAGSLEGKLPVALARRARERGARCLLVAGAIDVPREVLREAGFSAWLALDDVAPGEPPERALVVAARVLLGDVLD